MNNLADYLKGGDLRSTANVDELVPLIKTRKTFDDLFQYLFSDVRLIVMRAAEAVKKENIPSINARLRKLNG